MSLVITTNGNGVTIADGINSPVNFVNAQYTWYFHNDVLFLTAGGSKFYAAIGQVTVDGNTPNNETDLNTALGVVFPDSGGGATPTLAQVLDEGRSADDSKIEDLADPEDPQDAATKAYVDATISSTPNLGAVLAEGNDGGAALIKNIGDPVDPQDAATKAYVDAAVSGPLYLKYVALLTQSGTNAPVATELENTIGVIVWARASAGNYSATLSGAFPADKTFIASQYIVSAAGGALSINMSRTDDNTITIDTQVSGVGTDGILNVAPYLEIRVYP